MEKSKITTFFISLLGNNPVYFVGLMVEGFVFLELSEPKKVQGIKIVLSDQAYVHWIVERVITTAEMSHTETESYTDTSMT